MKWSACVTLILLLFSRWPLAGAGEPEDSLRLVPFPKEVRLETGEFDLDQSLVLQIPSTANASLANGLVAELQRVGLAAPQVIQVEMTEPWRPALLRR